MSYHILHIFSNGSYLHKERGMLVCENHHNKEVEKIPIEDLKGIVIAAKGITLSDSLISSVLKHDAFLLHCDEKFLPVGCTSSLARMIKPEIAFRQAKFHSSLNKSIWHQILSNKVFNQCQVIKYLGGKHEYLEQKSRSEKINEAICARYYWRQYFLKLGYPEERRMPGSDSDLNRKLNYGYAVMGSLCHRSIVIHGLSPVFGVHHVSRYRSNPLVYDIMEPLRAFIEKSLFDFERSDHKDMKAWSKFCINSWKEVKVWHKKFSLKLVDAVDFYVSSIARSFSRKNIQELWIPRLILKD